MSRSKFYLFLENINSAKWLICEIGVEILSSILWIHNVEMKIKHVLACKRLSLLYIDFSRIQVPLLIMFMYFEGNDLKKIDA